MLTCTSSMNFLPAGVCAQRALVETCIDKCAKARKCCQRERRWKGQTNFCLLSLEYGSINLLRIEIVRPLSPYIQIKSVFIKGNISSKTCPSNWLDGGALFVSGLAGNQLSTLKLLNAL